MGKKTDYKKMWRKAKRENVILANQKEVLKGRIESLTEILNKIKRGEIKIEGILKEEKEDKEMLEHLKKTAKKPKE